MSQLSDAIAQAGAPQVAAAIAVDPTFTVFNLLWSDPHEIAAACEALGLQTLEDVLAWVRATSTAVGNAPAFEQLVDPPAPATLAGMATTPWHRLHESIHATGLLASDCMLHNSDATYHLPTKAQWAAIAAACPAKRRRWVNETLDCDDFVRIAMGWLSSKGLGNTAAATVSSRHYMGTNCTGGHAVVLVWDETLTPWQWEPQTGVLHPANYAKLGGNFLANRVEFARIFA